MNDLLRSRQIKIFIIAIFLLGALPVFLKPPELGMDFVGGAVISVKAERPLSAEERQTAIAVLQNRLNSKGLKEIVVKSLGSQFLAVEFPYTSQEAVTEIQNIISEQGKFETLFESEVVLTGEDIVSVTTDPSQTNIFGAGPYEWRVSFLISNEAAARFADRIKFKCTQISGTERCAEVLYMFIDRPENAIILMNTSMYRAEQMIPDNLVDSPSTIGVEEIISNSGAELVVSDFLDNETISKIVNKTVLIAPASFNVGVLNQTAAAVREVEKLEKFWTPTALGLENIIHLTPGVTRGTPITNPVITGYSQTQERAVMEMNRVIILLRSGRLPVSVSVGGVSTIAPAFGLGVLKYIWLILILAVATIGAVVFFRYKRNGKITISMMLTTLSEVLMVLGSAALIGQQIDMPAVAGILIIIGTGTDHLVIITDEALMGGGQAELSLSRRIKKAFNIITMSVATVIFAMFPLLLMGVGALKGFAIVTIIGSLIGVLIARPTYAEIVNRIL